MWNVRQGLDFAAAVIAAVSATLALSAMAVAAEPAWTPDKAVEIIAPSAAGGGTDLTARTIQTILQQKRLLNVPTAVINKNGGGGNVALAYLATQAGSGHSLCVMSQLILTNYIVGRSTFSYADFTPIAQLTSEYVAIAVRRDSPIASAADLLSKLKADPGSISIAVGTSLGGAHHIAAALATQAAGGDIKKLKAVVFKSSAESTTALLGGHVDVASASVSLFGPQLAAGTLRVLAIAAPRRGDGALATIPTWTELGHNIVVDNFRTLIGPPGMTPAQLAYWDALLERLSRMDEWKKKDENDLWENNYMGSKDARRYLDTQYEELHRVLSGLGIAKK